MLLETIVSAPRKWKGKSTLHMSWLPMEERLRESHSTLEFDLGPQNNIVIIRYNWDEKGPQMGQILLALDGELAQGGWMDSWHQSGAVMHLKGKVADPHTVSIQGTYSASPDPDWGWRISMKIMAEPNLLSIEMTNISPTGEEEWAVRSHYVPA